MLCGSRFVCEFNIYELQAGQLVCSRDYQVIKGISWCLCVRRSFIKNNTGVLEDVIRTNDEILGLPLAIPRKAIPVEPSKKASRFRSKKRVHFVDESTDSDDGDHKCKNSLNVNRRPPENINPRQDSSNTYFKSSFKTTRNVFTRGSFESEDNFRDESDADSDFENQYPRQFEERRSLQSMYVDKQISSDSENDSEITSQPLRGSRSHVVDRQNGFEITSSSESDDPRDRPRILQTLKGEISKGKSRSSRNRRYGRILRENSSPDEQKKTCLDFYLKMKESIHGRLKHCTANFTLDIVNKNRGMRKVRKYKYQTFFPNDVSGWTNIITWNDLTNRDNCFVDKNGYFQIEAAVIVLNTKMLIERIKPEKLETIV